MSLLRVGNQSSDVTDSGDEEGEWLKEEVDEVSVLPEVEIVPATEEEVGSNTKLEHMESVHPQSERRWNLQIQKLEATVVFYSLEYKHC